MNKQFLLFLFAIMVTLSCNRCKDECDDLTNPECPNYEPCWDQQPFSGDFKILTSHYLAPDGIEVPDGDTAWCKATFQFKPTYEVDSVKWQVGSDPSVNTSLTYSLHFNVPYSNVPITCIAYGKQNANCFDTAIVTDTVVKYLTVVHWPDLPVWTWRFRCHYNDEPQNEFDIHFETEITNVSDPNMPLGNVDAYGFAHLGTCFLLGTTNRNHRLVDFDGAGPAPCMSDWEFGNPSWLQISTDKRSLFGKFGNYPSTGRTISGYKIN